MAIWYKSKYCSSLALLPEALHSTPPKHDKADRTVKSCGVIALGQMDAYRADRTENEKVGAFRAEK